MRLKSLSSLLILAIAATAAPAIADADVTTYHLDGTIGAYPVGVSLSVKDGTSIAAGHYYYDSQLKDIPLTGSVNGRSVTLTTPTGETFHLTMQGNGGTGGDGSSFTTSVALNGTWTNGSQTLPAKLGMDFVNDGLPNGHMYADVTGESDMAFEAQVARFLKAALAGDKPAVAAAVSYPLRVNGKHALTIRSAAQLTSQWSAVFTPAMLAQLKTAVPHEMFVHEGQAMVAGGLVWFDAKGATAINEP
jgi:hypothetical protein